MSYFWNDVLINFKICRAIDGNDKENPKKKKSKLAELSQTVAANSKLLESLTALPEAVGKLMSAINGLKGDAANEATDKENGSLDAVDSLISSVADGESETNQRGGEQN